MTVIKLPTVPTDEGRRRYADTDGYYPDRSLHTRSPDIYSPCTCVAGCAPRCGGKCHCTACGLDFKVYCDVARLLTPDGLKVSEEDAVARYREEAPIQTAYVGR